MSRLGFIHQFPYKSPAWRFAGALLRELDRDSQTETAIARVAQDCGCWQRDLDDVVERALEQGLARSVAVPVIGEFAVEFVGGLRRVG